MEKEYVLITDIIEILKRIKACLSYDDWMTAKEYINIEIKKLQNKNKD